MFRRSATGGGGAKAIRDAGFPTMEFAPETDTIHAADEFTTVEILRGIAESYTRLPLPLATAVGA